MKRELRKPSITINMKTESLKLLTLILILYSLVKAQPPDGYLGCFDGSSLINETKTCNYLNYTGDSCKAECKRQHKRYAGTKHGSECSCGDVYQTDKYRNATECNWHCPGKTTEMCGSVSTLSLYNTWACKTDTCENRETIIDTEGIHFSCICIDGWTGTFCDEKVNATISSEFLFSSSSSSLSSSSTPQKISIPVTPTKQPSTQSSCFAGNVDTKTTVLGGIQTTNNTYLHSNLTATDSKNDTAVYISVPVIMLIIVVVCVIIFLIIRRKRQLMKQDSNDMYNSSNGNTLSFSDENNPIYNDHDKIQLDIATCHKDTTENAMSEKNGSAFEEISHHYNTIDPPYHSETEIQTEIPVDEDDYEHIKSTTNVVFDPTYSHTTDLQTEHTNDEMYSQVNNVAKKPKLNSNTNQNNETYDTLKNNTTKGAPKPVVHSGETDETYNTVSKTGKTTSRGDSNTPSSLNEPDYDHIDSKDL